MYQHTKFSLAYLLSDSDTRPSPGHLFLAMYDHWFKPMHAFDDYLSSQKQLAYPAVEPTDPLINPYTTYFSQQGTPVWSIMAQDPEKLAVFQKGMAGIDVAIPPVGHFPFATLANTPFNSESKDEEEEGVMQLVDVGGGQGLALNKILQAHPELDPKLVVLQDRPDVVALAREARVLPEGVRVMEHDFMGVQPLKGVFYFYSSLCFPFLFFSSFFLFCLSVCPTVLSWQKQNGIEHKRTEWLMMETKKQGQRLISCA